MLPEFSLQGKLAVVTGGARGLGLEMLRALAEAGAAVVAVDLLEEQAREAAERAAADYGVRAAARAVDVTRQEAVARAFGEIAAEWGAIDVLIAAAGIVENVAAEDTAAAAWRRVIDVNVNGVFYCAQAAGRAMLARQ